MRSIEIYDTTLRDGSQGEGVNFSLADKLAITQRLDEAGVDFIEGGYPLSNPKDAEYFKQARDLQLSHSRVAAFGMTRRRGMAAADDPGMKALLEAGTSVITIVGKTSAFHVSEVLGVSLASVVDAPLGIHCHNDCDLGVANTLAGVAAGCVQAQGTINGVGERCGNADLISVVANLALKLPGFQVLGGTGTKHLTELSRFVYETANMSYRPGQAFVGGSAFAHKGGMHVHAVAKAAESYEHIPPEAVGNSRRVLVSELSGRSNIAAVVKRADIKEDRTLQEKVLSEVCRLENEGWQFEAAGATFDLLVDRLAGTFRPAFERISYHVLVESRDGRDGELRTEATVKLKIGDTVRHEVGEGDGPVNALDAAVRKALGPHYPAIEKMHLLDYKVRVINGQEGTAARVRVLIESTDGEEIWGTVGVSENVIEASWLALSDAFEAFLARHG